MALASPFSTTVTGQMDAIIRTLTADDAAAYWQLRLESLERNPDAFGMSVVEHRRSGVSDTAAMLDSPDTWLFGVLHDSRLRGIATLQRSCREKFRHSAEVRGVYLNASVRGLGLGRKLLEAVIARAEATSGVEVLTLSVILCHDAPRQLYLSAGFIPFGIQRRAMKVGSQYFDKEYMQRQNRDEANLAGMGEAFHAQPDRHLHPSE